MTAEVESSATNTSASNHLAGATAGTNTASTASAAGDKKSGGTNDQIQVSFQGANIDMIVQWLAQKTGKSVIKHPQVQCQLTITSSKKVSTREAINLVYRALSLEGFVVVESADAILIAPESKEPKLNPAIIDAQHPQIPEGRQLLVKIFPLAHVQAGELRDKLRPVLSDKGSLETDEQANQLIVSDYNDNLRLIADLIKEFDVPASGLNLQVFPLQHGDAEELGNFLSLILNSQSGGGATPARSPSHTSSPSPHPGMPIPGGLPPGVQSGSHSSPPSAGGSAPGQAVRIWPDKSANRLIVFAPQSRFPEIRRLVSILDTQKPQDVSIRVIPLKNIDAVDLVKDLSPLYQKMSGNSPKETIQVAANDRANSLLVLSSEENFRALQTVVAGLDTEDAQDKIMRTFPLKNADAEDVAKQLQQLNQDQQTYSRYVYYFSSSPSGRNTRKMSIVSDRRRNSVIVQAAPAQMEGIAKMIEELDQPVSDDSLAPRIYHLKYVSAVDIEDVLNELFLKKTQQRNYWDFFSDYSPEPTADRDVGRLYGKVRITSEPYSNTLIITSNSKESLDVIENVLRQLDLPSEAGESTLRIDLKFAKASTVANSINILFAKNGSPPLRPPTPQAQQNNQFQQYQQQPQGGSSQAGFDLEQETKEEAYYPWLGGQPDTYRSSDGRNTTRPVSDLVGRVRAVADERSNAVLISANVHFFPQLLKLVADLDMPTDQVLIEARLVEVSSDFLDQLGVRWSPNGSQVFSGEDYDNSFLINGSANYLQGVGGKSQVNTPLSPFSSSANFANPIQALTTLRSGVLSATMNMDFLIQFLKKNTDARVLAEPQVNIRDNQTGRIFVGQQVPILTAQNNPALGGTSQNFVYKDVGVILEVTPHINTQGDVELRIHAESSTVVPGEVILNGAVFDTRNFRTDLTAHDGQTLVLGGIIQRQVSNTVRKTPLLGDIPGLGWLFKKRDQSSHEVELMVFMRPKINRNPEDGQRMIEDIYKTAPKLRDWNEGLGPDNQPKSREHKSGNENSAG